MKFLLLLILMASGSSAFADESHRPRSFSYKGSKAVFLDLIDAFYDVTVDATKAGEDSQMDKPLDQIGNKSLIRSKIVFDMPEEGYPVFDNYFLPRNLKIDGLSVKQLEVKPPEVSVKLRVIQSIIKPGRHTLEAETVPYGEFIRKDASGGLNVFSTLADNESRGFLEYDMPAGFEYDQVKMRMRFKLIGTAKEHRMYSNGVVTQPDHATFEIDFPETYTNSSPFFHLVATDNVTEINFDLTSIDGRTVPAVAYYLKDDEDGSKAELLNLVARAKATFAKSESLLGAYIHSSMVIYNEGGKDSSDGMEYCGAMRATTQNVSHEILHSWYARGAMPANGNASWIDESVVTWLDEGDPVITKLTPDMTFTGITLPYYQRENGADAYNGVRFLSYLHNVTLNSKGGLYPFLREFFQAHKHTTYTSEEFINEMSTYAGEDLNPLFKKIAGKKYVPAKD